MNNMKDEEKMRINERLGIPKRGKNSYSKILSLITFHLLFLGIIRSRKIEKYRNSNHFKSNIFLICVNTIMCVSSVIQASSFIIFEPWNNVYEKMEPIQFFCQFLHDVFLYAFLVKNRFKIMKLLKEMDRNFRGFERLILKKKRSDEEHISKQILLAVCSVLMAISAAYISHVSAKIHEDSFLFPISLKVTREELSNNNPYLFYFTQFYQFSCGCFSCIVNSTGVILTITLFMMLGSQYEILQYCFENARNTRICRMYLLNKEPFGNENDVSFDQLPDVFMECTHNDALLSEEIFEQNLKNCIKYHMYLKELVADVQTILNSIIFVLFVTCEFMLCLCSFQIFQIYEELSFLQLAKCVSMLVAILFVEFTSFWYAQQLTLKTEKLFSAIYFSNWYSGSKRYKSCIKIILLNTKTPFIVNAGMIVPVTLASFVRSLQAAFSYFNLLRKLTEAKL